MRRYGALVRRNLPCPHLLRSLANLTNEPNPALFRDTANAFPEHRTRRTPRPLKPYPLNMRPANPHLF